MSRRASRSLGRTEMRSKSPVSQFTELSRTSPLLKELKKRLLAKSESPITTILVRGAPSTGSAPKGCGGIDGDPDGERADDLVVVAALAVGVPLRPTEDGRRREERGDGDLVPRVEDVGDFEIGGLIGERNDRRGVVVEAEVVDGVGDLGVAHVVVDLVCGLAERLVEAVAALADERRARVVGDGAGKVDDRALADGDAPLFEDGGVARRGVGIEEEERVAPAAQVVVQGPDFLFEQLALRAGDDDRRRIVGDRAGGDDVQRADGVVVALDAEAGEPVAGVVGAGDVALAVPDGEIDDLLLGPRPPRGWPG